MIIFLLLLNLSALNATVTQWFVHAHDDVTILSWYCDKKHIPEIRQIDSRTKIHIDQSAAITPKRLGPCTIESDDDGVYLILPADYWYMLGRGTAVQEKECGIVVLGKRRTPKLYGKHAVRIDPGHGGQDAGAVYGNVTEKDIALDIAKQLAKICAEKKIPNIVTRTRDITTTLDARTQNATHDQFFISIHCNAAKNTNTRGVEILYPAWSKLQIIASTMPKGWQHYFAQLEKKSKEFAEAILSVLTATPINGYTVERRSRVPAVSQVLCGSCTTAILIEAGFLTNVQERAWIADAGVQQEIAKRISTVIKEDDPLVYKKVIQ